VYDQTLLSDTPASAHQTYTMLNAMVGYARTWRRHRLDLHLMGKNLADEHYRPSQSTRGRPREILLSLTASL
jgi:iron complex outermembrane recepter protein